jgi:hypothetical protein
MRGKNLWAIQKGTGTKSPIMMAMGMTREVKVSTKERDRLIQTREGRDVLKYLVPGAYIESARAPQVTACELND